MPMIRNEEMDYIDSHPLIRKILINLRLPEWAIKLLVKSNNATALKIDPRTGQI